MRCANCGHFSLAVICKICKDHLRSSPARTRVLDGDFKIYSFFDYSEVKNLLHSKHLFHGSFVYGALANLSFKVFARKFSFGSPVHAVPIDDRAVSGYSHTAILARALKSRDVRPIYACLHAGSNVSYHGKDLAFRLKNPRNFKLLKRPKFPVILIDDIVTTGTTIDEARRTLQKAGCEVLFALTLADARY